MPPGAQSWDDSHSSDTPAVLHLLLSAQGAYLNTVFSFWAQDLVFSRWSEHALCHLAPTKNPLQLISSEIYALITVPPLLGHRKSENI